MTHSLITELKELGLVHRSPGGAWKFNVGDDKTRMDDREAELRQWWQTLGRALQRQSPARLDALGISPGKVRSRLKQLVNERLGWERRWELFVEVVFEVGEDAFVKLTGAKQDG